MEALKSTDKGRSRPRTRHTRSVELIFDGIASSRFSLGDDLLDDGDGKSRQSSDQDRCLTRPYEDQSSVIGQNGLFKPLGGSLRMAGLIQNGDPTTEWFPSARDEMKSPEQAGILANGPSRQSVFVRTLLNGQIESGPFGYFDRQMCAN